MTSPGDQDKRDQAAALHAAAARLLRLARRGDGLAGSGPAQTSALGALLECGPMSVKDLARYEGVSHPTMSRMLAMMERPGLVAKARDRRDQRRQIVKITAKGRRTYAAAYARRQQMIDAVVALLRPESVEDLTRVLSLLSRRVTGKDA